MNEITAVIAVSTCDVNKIMECETEKLHLT